MVLYRIKNNRTGDYSVGGAYPGWSKYGKLWSLSNLKKHLSLVKKCKGEEEYNHCSVEAYNVHKTWDIDVNEWIALPAGRQE